MLYTLRQHIYQFIKPVLANTAKHKQYKRTTTKSLLAAITLYTSYYCIKNQYQLSNNYVYASNDNDNDIELDEYGRPCRICSNKDIYNNTLQRSKQLTQSQHTENDNDILSCPVDLTVLGNSTWIFLHTMCAYYPDKPTQQQQQLMIQFIHSLGEFFPCHNCARHLRQYIKQHPIQCDSKQSLSLWFCNMHNDVNKRLNKPLYDCNDLERQYYDNDGKPCLDLGTGEIVDD